MAIIRAARVGPGLFSAAVPAGLRGRWCLLWLNRATRAAGARRPGPARVSMSLEGDRFPPVWSDLGRLPQPLGEAAAVFVLPDAMTLRLDIPAVTGSMENLVLRLMPVGQAVAAMALAASQPRAFLRAMAGDGSPRGVRAALAVLGTPGAPRRDYAEWVALFDDSPAAPGSAERSAVQLVVWPSRSPAALAATLASIDRQSARAPAPVQPGELASVQAEYVGLLQAGEMLAPNALATLDAEIAEAQSPDALFADEDELDANGIRGAPNFKPDASHTLMLSGTLTRGLWVFRRDCLGGSVEGSAEATRLAVWLELWRRGGPTRTRHIPRILVHRRTDTDAAPSTALADVVGRHLSAAKLPARVASLEDFKLHVSFTADPGSMGKLALIVPTSARLPHIGHCLSSVLARTDCEFEMLLVLSQSTPPDAEQSATLAQIMNDPRVRLVLAGDGPFNYARANNAGVAATDSTVLCFINDDVEPLESGWVRAMAGHLADARVGAVGAKLLFPDRTVQHAGIVMGLSGLAGHAFSGLSGDDPGYQHRAALTQEVSAATGACLMVRRDAYADIGGMDESFPIAFNDVALCLALRERGWGIVWSAEAELVHHESVSRGPHGTGPGSGDEPAAARRVRDRWPQSCAEDPFYNPNLSIVPGREWTPAFPPRGQDAAGKPVRKTA